MKIMKKNRLLALVLVIATLVSTFVFTTPSGAEAISKDVKITGGMVLSKTVEATDDPYKFKITLGAYSTGEAYTIKTEVSRPVDIILVIDESGSMDWDFSNKKSRWEATQDAINLFINNIKADADKYKVNHRIAITTYADSSYIYIGKDHWSSSKVETSSVTNTSKYEQISDLTNEDYRELAEDGALFVSSQGEYKQVKVSRSYSNMTYNYTYTFPDGSTLQSSKKATVPSFGETKLYTYGKDSIVSAALQDVTVPSQLYNLQRTIGNPAKDISSAIDPGGGTYPSGAAKLANDIFEAHKDDYGKEDKRAKLVIYFTDGMPGDGNDFSTKEAGKTLPYFNQLKQNDVDVYSVGVFPEADCTNPQTLPTGTGDNDLANKFMFLCSSYYPEASSMSSTGPIVGDYENRPYYMSPQDVQALSDTFQIISDAIHYEYTEVVLTEKAMIKDVITPYFAGPKKVNDIEAYYLMCTDVDQNDDRLRTFGTTHVPADDLHIEILSYDEDAEVDSTIVGDLPNDTVIATNFNYKENWCGKDDGVARGKQVVIEFYVTVRDEFLGGNGVPTNQPQSGLYDDEGRLLPGFDFPMPESKDVQIKDYTIDVEAATKHVYLYGDLTEDDLKIDSTIHVYNEDKSTNCILKLDKPNYGLSEWKVDHITVETEIPKAPINDITADMTYNIKATVSPTIEEGACVPKSDTSDDTAVLCYVPMITFKDSTITAGTKPDYDNNIATVEWVHKDATDGKWKTSDKMMGTEPKLSFVYDPTAAVIYDDSHVKVTNVYIDSDGNGSCDKDITSYCLFDHETCDVEGCTFDSTKDSFVVHVTGKTANIVIENTGDTVDANDTFVYTITSDSDDSYKQTVVIQGTGSVVITGLPVAKYTVTQDESWSYNYECKTNPQEKTLQGEPADGRNNVFTFENSKDNVKNIRESFDYVKNIFKSSGDVVAE